MPSNPAKIFTSHKPVFLNISQVCEVDGYLRFGIDSEKVDNLVASLMKVFQHYKADEVVTAVGICFFLVMRRFELKQSSYIAFIHNFLFKGGDQKLSSHALERMFGNLYQNHLTRFEKVCFNKGVRT